jgi:Ser/Thr protein kinase RdoA (MazF antagonist)
LGRRPYRAGGLTSDRVHDTTPQLSLVEASSLLEDEFDLAGDLAPLPSERDQNFLAQTPDGCKFVLKIAKSDERREVLELQNAAIAHLRRELADLDWPELRRTVRGAQIAETRDHRGRTHFARLFSWVEGTPFVHAAPHDSKLLGSLGRALARIDRSLERFTHPAMHRALHWDLKRADQAFRHAHLLSIAQRALIEDHIGAWRELPWPLLRHGVIHGDANDYNVLVRAGEVAALLDFGDMVHSAVVCDLAIGAAYAMLGKRDALSAARQVIGSYCCALPLTPAEAEAVFPLISTRLAMSVCYSAHNAREKSDDPYQQVSSAPAWQLLADLAALPPGFALEACRDAALRERR